MNKAIICGYVGKDPDVRQTQAGVSVASFSIATTERWKDKNGEKKEQTEWHNCVAWDKLAGICKDYVRKGSQVLVEGKIQTRKWQDKDGQDRWTTEILVKGIHLIGGGRGPGGGDDHGDDGSCGNDVPF